MGIFSYKLFTRIIMCTSTIYIAGLRDDFSQYETIEKLFQIGQNHPAFIQCHIIESNIFYYLN